MGLVIEAYTVIMSFKFNDWLYSEVNPSNQKRLGTNIHPAGFKGFGNHTLYILIENILR